MPRCICYWINSAVNLAFHSQPFPFINPLGQLPHTQEYTRTPATAKPAMHVSVFSQPFSWSHSASQTRRSSCCSQLTGSGHVVAAIKICHEDSSSINLWTLFIAPLKQTLSQEAWGVSLENTESNSQASGANWGNRRAGNAASTFFSSPLQFTKHLLLHVVTFHPHTHPGGSQGRHQ